MLFAVVRRVAVIKAFLNEALFVTEGTSDWPLAAPEVTSISRQGLPMN